MILFDVDGDAVSNIDFQGVCNGNLKIIAKIVAGWTVAQIVSTLSGNTCGIVRLQQFRKLTCSKQHFDL